MYVDRMDLTAGLGGASELQDGITKLGDLRKGVKGYLGQTLLRSYAYSDKFVVMGRWENVEAAWEFSSSDILASFLKQMPSDASAITRTRFEGYDSVVEVNADPSPSFDDARCEVFADWILASVGKVAEFEQSRRELFALQLANIEGFVSARLRRSAGIPTKYLMLGIFRDKAAAQGGQGIPQLREFVASHPATNYANVPPSIEAYAVIHRM